MCATPNVVDKAKRYTKSDVRARDLPGMRWFILSLYVAFVSAARPVLTLSGWPLPMQFSNHIGIALTFLLMGIGTYRYLITQKVHLLYRKSYLMKTKIWFALLVMLACYGIFRRNEFLYVIREMIVFSYIGVFLLFGGDDRFWQVMVKHLTILFYAGCLLIFVFFQVPMASIEELGKDIGALTLVGERYTWSVSYYLRPLIATGLLIGMWGLIGREGRTWKIFQIPAWFLFFACEVGLFKFRAAAGFVILAVLSYILLKPYLEQRLRLGIPLIFLSLCFVAFTYYISTQSWELVINRVAESRQGEGIFGSRLAEFHAYMSDMGLMVLAGR